MARRTFSMVDVAEILEHWYAGRPKVEVARSLGVDAKTVRKYVGAAVPAGVGPGGPPAAPERRLAVARGWVPALARLPPLRAHGPAVARPPAPHAGLAA